MPIKLSSKFRQKFRLLANHEAGHYFVARILGFKTYQISLSVSQNGQSGASELNPLMSGVKDFKKLEDYLERRLQVLYAGAMSEATNAIGEYNGKYASQEWSKGGALNDYAKIRELVRVLRNVRHPDTIIESDIDKEFEKIENDLMSRTLKIIKENYSLIQEIGALLDSRASYFDIAYKLSDVEINEIPNVTFFFTNR